MEFGLQDIQECRRLIQRRHARMRVQHLLQQRRAAARMPAQKRQPRNRLALDLGERLRPGAQNRLGQAPSKAPRALRALVITLQQHLRIRQATHDLLCLNQQPHRLVTPPVPIKNLGQFVATGVANVRMPGLGGDQGPEPPFRRLELTLPPVQHGGEITRLIILRINGQALLHGSARLFQAVALFA